MSNSTTSKPDNMLTTVNKEGFTLQAPCATVTSEIMTTHVSAMCRPTYYQLPQLRPLICSLLFGTT